MKSLDTTLHNLGLTAIQSKIYLSLIKHGSMKITDIAKDINHHRPAVYRSVIGLVELGLTTEVVEGKRKLYRATNPEKLYHLMYNLEDQVTQIIPKLAEQYAKTESTVTIEHLKGSSGINQAFLDIVDTLKRGETFYRYSSAHNQIKNNSYVPKEYRKIRDAKALKRQVITNKAAGNTKKLRINRDMKFIDPETNEFKQDIVQFMYADKVSLVDYNSENVYIIQNKAIAEFQKNIFKTLYKKLN